VNFGEIQRVLEDLGILVLIATRRDHTFFKKRSAEDANMLGEPLSELFRISNDHRNKNFVTRFDEGN
jgi:hypothetical protein